MKGVVYGYDPDPHCEECGAAMEIDMGEDRDDPSHQYQVNTCPRCVPACPVCEDSGIACTNCGVS